MSEEIKYYLHRISHEDQISYSLLKKGYLTLGWSSFTDSGILDAARVDGYPDFDKITEREGENKNRSRWSMWYFARMKEGDMVVVPQYDGLFSIYRVLAPAVPIAEIKNDVESVTGMWDKNITAVWKDNLLVTDRVIDLGFAISVAPVIEDTKRSFLPGKLTSRMKIQTTSADISDLQEYIEMGIEACKNGKPVTIYEASICNLVDEMQEKINGILNDSRFEKLIEWYLQEIGATSTWIPAKNEAGKREGADVDIVAVFENLHFIVYVQAKWHTGKTDGWAVEQISKYVDQREDRGDNYLDYTYAAWVISSADRFSDDAMSDAKDKNVRLIDGKEFSKMLIDVGLLNINDAFSSIW